MDPYDTQLNAALEYSRVLAEVEREIVSAFTQHFAGKPGQYVPAVRCDHNRQNAYEIATKVANAIEDTHDYPNVLPVFHAVMIGSKSLGDYRAAIVREYMRLHAADIAERRSGIDAPLTYVAPSIPAFLMKEAA